MLLKLWVAIVIGLPLFFFCGGCGTTGEPEDVSPQYHHFIKTPIVTPMNFLSGEQWDWGVLPQNEVDKVLELELPDANKVAPDKSLTDVIQEVTGKRIVWIPNTDGESRNYREAWQEWISNDPENTEKSTVGEWVRGAITGFSEWGFYKEVSGLDKNFKYLSIAIITEDFIILTFVPNGLKKTPKKK
jgi:hypothetical protein